MISNNDDMYSHTFHGVIWYFVKEINTIQLHDFPVMVTLERISLHYITFKTTRPLTLEPHTACSHKCT